MAHAPPATAGNEQVKKERKERERKTEILLYEVAAKTGHEVWRWSKAVVARGSASRWLLGFLLISGEVVEGEGGGGGGGGAWASPGATGTHTHARGSSPSPRREDVSPATCSS